MTIEIEHTNKEEINVDNISDISQRRMQDISAYVYVCVSLLGDLLDHSRLDNIFVKLHRVICEVASIAVNFNTMSVLLKQNTQQNVNC